MKKIWNQVLMASLVVGIAGCECKCDKEKSGSGSEPNPELQAALEEFAEEAKAALAEDSAGVALVHDFNDYPAKGKRNITIKYTDANTVQLIVKKIGSTTSQRYRNPKREIQFYDSIVSVESVANYTYDLTSEGVEIWLKKGGDFETKGVAHNSPYSNGTTATVSIDEDFDAKLVPTYQHTGTTAFVGGQDTREVTGSLQGYLTCDLEYKPYNRKRLRVWYDGGNLTISANQNTKAVKTELNTCYIEFEGWGDDFQYNARSKSKCVPSP